MPVDRDRDELRAGHAEVAPGVGLHFFTAGCGPRTIVLLHGFPQTSWMWRRSVPALVAAGFRVVAPDYRGAGLSWRPPDGYDKRTMAGDVHRLLRSHLEIEGPVVLVGHEIGAMIAYAYARAFPGEVSHLVMIDGPLPGTRGFSFLYADPWMWDVAGEAPIAGPLRRYLVGYFAGRAHVGSGINAVDLETYVSAYDPPRAMQVSRALFAAFDRDAADNRAALDHNGRLAIPVLALSGASSAAGPRVEGMLREVATDVTALCIPGAGHWIADEQPHALTRALVAFAATHGAGRARQPATLA